MVSQAKLPLPKFLQMLSTTLPMTKAMALSKIVYKQLDTPAKLVECSDANLVSMGIGSKEDRQNILKAVKKAGYAAPKKKLSGSEISDPVASSSSTTAAIAKLTTPPKRKRKRGVSQDREELLPDGPPDEAKQLSSLDFGEILEESLLRARTTRTNRAPVMTAWATIVAERMGFQREEALSIASVYTELNALSKGASIGRYASDKTKELEATPNGNQPYVEFMGRKIALYQTSTKDNAKTSVQASSPNQWRALMNNEPVKPSQAFGYISRAFRQNTPYIIGAMTLLARSWSAEELKQRGWRLYTDFRPPTKDGWGEQGELKCSTILDLRATQTKMSGAESNQIVGGIQPSLAIQIADTTNSQQSDPMEPPPAKKHKELTLEEYEALLDEEDATLYSGLDL
ncbi:hypothetical protein DL96DRAFT_1785244 [Flagelloscypha sp. PMI_526]|nr:hypothetical protein DL96DRAFT_1785244 [Flagelloscypha sp. PMI_526]